MVRLEWGSGVKMEREVKSVKITAEESMPHLWCVRERKRERGDGGKKKVKVKLCSSDDGKIATVRS